MSDFSEQTAIQTSLQAGLEALKQQDYPAVISHLETCQASLDPAVDPATHLKIQMGLIKAYARTDHPQAAAQLCRPLCNHSNPKVQAWATQTLTELEPQQIQPPYTTLQLDPTGCTPTSSDPSGFVPLSTPPNPSTSLKQAKAKAQPKSSPVPQQQTTTNQPSSELTKPPSSSNAAHPLIHPTAPQKQATTHPLSKTKAPPSLWQNANRLSRWNSLGKVDASGLWALQAGSLVLLFWLTKTLIEVLFRSWNSLSLWLEKWLNIPRLLLPESVSVGVLVILLGLWLVSPWLLDWILQNIYKLQSFSLAQLERRSPESGRLLRRTGSHQINQPRLPVPSLGLLPISAPLIFTFGYLPSKARLVVSQGLLDQLNDDEIAALVAAELAHIRYWDFGTLSAITLVMQLPYLLYWQAGIWGRRQNPVLRTLALVIASISYGLFRWLRLAGLWLSRVRLYYSDQLATDLTGNPNGLTRALLKLSLGTAAALEQNQTGMPTGSPTGSLTGTLTGTPKNLLPILEGFELLTPVGYRSALTLGSLLSSLDESTGLALLDWDRQSPYRRWLVLNNAHPLLGERLALLLKYSEQWRLQPELRWGMVSSLRFQLGRLLLQGAPFFGIPIGLGVGFLLKGLGLLARRWRWFELAWLANDPSVLLACCLLGFGIGMLLRINSFYPDIKRLNLQANPDLVNWLSNSQALPLDSQPIQLKGLLIAQRGLPNGCQNLILQTPAGLIRLHHCSKLGWISDLLPQSLWPAAMFDRPVAVTGWFRRGATPWIDIDRIQAEYGRTVYSYHPIWSTVLASAAVLLGVLLFL